MAGKPRLNISAANPPEVCWYTGLSTSVQLMKNIPVAMRRPSSTPWRRDVAVPRAPGRVKNPAMAKGRATTALMSPARADRSTPVLKTTL